MPSHSTRLDSNTQVSHRLAIDTHTLCNIELPHCLLVIGMPSHDSTPQPQHTGEVPACRCLLLLVKL